MVTMPTVTAIRPETTSCPADAANRVWRPRITATAARPNAVPTSEPATAMASAWAPTTGPAGGVGAPQAQVGLLPPLGGGEDVAA